MDIVVFEFIAGAHPVSVAKLIEERAGGLVLDTRDEDGTKRLSELDAASRPLGQWKRGALRIDPKQVTVHRDGTLPFGTSLNPPPHDSIRIFIGASEVTSAPWQVRFDDIVCTRE